MKKKFNKKKLLTFGIIGLLALVLVSAALVGYLSNTVKADVTVESPIEVGISLGGWAETMVEHPTFGMVDCYPNNHDLKYWTITDTTLPIDSVHGGGIVTLYTLSENVGEVEITAHEEIRISNPDGVTCDDFKSITSRFDSIYGELGYGGWGDDDVPGEDCHNINPKLIEIWSADDTSKWGAGEADVAEWVITFKEDATGTYTFSYRVIPEVAE